MLINNNSYIFSRFALILLISLCIVMSMHTEVYAEEDFPLSYYSVIEERNIFRPTNNSEVAAPTILKIAPQETSEVNNIILTGIIKIRGKYKAILEKKNEQSGFYVVVDDVIDNYTVVDIAHDSIVLEKDGELLTLKIATAKKAKSKERPKYDIKETLNPQDDGMKMTPEQMLKTNAMRTLRMGSPK